MKRTELHNLWLYKAVEVNWIESLFFTQLKNSRDQSKTQEKSKTGSRKHNTTQANPAKQ